MATFSHSYLITNRARPFEDNYESIAPLAPPGNFYFVAPGPYNEQPTAFVQLNSRPGDSMPQQFSDSLEHDLETAVKNGCPQLTVFIHGGDYCLTNAMTYLGQFGGNLEKQGYQGLLVGYSWPAYCSVAATWRHYGPPYSFPPQSTSGTMRGNVNGSTQSVLNAFEGLSRLCKKHGAKLNVVCHSEGNYLLMLAMYVYQRSRSDALFAHVLMLAADINNGAFQAEDDAPFAGQGRWIARSANDVSVFWSSHDDVLSGVETGGFAALHNPSFPNRLGLHGLASTGSLPRSIYVIDCTDIVNTWNRTRWCPLESIHLSYLFIPEALQRMILKLT